MPKPEVPAAAGKRMCGMCGKPLSQYNKDDICMSHKTAEVARYREKVDGQKKQSRAIRSFVREFHSESTAREMFQAALSKKKAVKAVHRSAAMELASYFEALGLLKSASRVFRISMFSILRLNSTHRKLKVSREVIMYLMSTQLNMEIQDIGTFLGYNYLPNVERSMERVTYALLEDEDIILAVDLVWEEYTRVEEAA